MWIPLALLGLEMFLKPKQGCETGMREVLRWQMLNQKLVKNLKNMELQQSQTAWVIKLFKNIYIWDYGEQTVDVSNQILKSSMSLESSAMLCVSPQESVQVRTGGDVEMLELQSFILTIQDEG